MAMLDNFQDLHKKIQHASEKKRLAGKLMIRVSFDRSKPTVKIYDNTSSVELNAIELEALLSWLQNPS